MAKHKQEESVAPKPKRYLMGWRCPKCGMTRSDFIEAGYFPPLICNSPYGVDANGKRVGLQSGERCDAYMEVKHDERP